MLQIPGGEEHSAYLLLLTLTGARGVTDVIIIFACFPYRVRVCGVFVLSES